MSNVSNVWLVNFSLPALRVVKPNCQVYPKKEKGRRKKKKRKKKKRKKKKKKKKKKKR